MNMKLSQNTPASAASRNRALDDLSFIKNNRTKTVFAAAMMTLIIALNGPSRTKAEPTVAASNSSKAAQIISGVRQSCKVPRSYRSSRQVKQRQQDDPDDVDQVPIQRDAFERRSPSRQTLAVEQRRRHGHDADADDQVNGVDPGRDPIKCPEDLRSAGCSGKVGPGKSPLTMSS